jgi:hypothetical protein
MRLHWSHPGGHSIIDLINVYRPPISCTPNDIRTDRFDINQFATSIHENEKLRTEASLEYHDAPTHQYCIPTTVGTILCGDFNAHHKTWDKLSQPDAHGNKISKFATHHNLKIANTGIPTCFLNRKRPTAVDLTLSGGSVVVTNWSADHPPLGKVPTAFFRILLPHSLHIHCNSSMLMKKSLNASTIHGKKQIGKDSTVKLMMSSLVQATNLLLTKQQK